jgi:hypothetical protein
VLALTPSMPESPVWPAPGPSPSAVLCLPLRSDASGQMVYCAVSVTVVERTKEPDVPVMGMVNVIGGGGGGAFFPPHAASSVSPASSSVNDR